MDGSIILTALLPAIIDIIKRAADRIITGRPLSTDDEIRLMEAEARKLKALAELDVPPENLPPWAATIRALYRYAFCTLVLIMTFILQITKTQPEFQIYWLDLTAGVAFFLIGHRTYAYIRSKK